MFKCRFQYKPDEVLVPKQKELTITQLETAIHSDSNNWQPQEPDKVWLPYSGKMGDKPNLEVQPTSIEEAANSYSNSIERSEDGAIQEAYIQGAKRQEGIVIKFAEWIVKNKYLSCSDGKSLWWQKNLTNYSTEELFEIFKQEK